MTDEAVVGNELVSVVIPAYNAAATLPATLRSVRAQSHRNLEILVVDDGSRDATATIVRQAAAEDPRVQLLQKPNGGLPSARNFGIARASGSMIAPVDADDLWHPDKIAQQLAVMRRGGTAVGMVYCWSWMIDQNGRCLPRGHIALRYEGAVYGALILHNFIGNGSTPLFRRTALDAVGGFDESLNEGCEDLACYLAVAERFRVAVAPAFLVGYRQSATSMSLSIERMRRSFATVLDAARRRHPELPSALVRWSQAKQCFYLAKRCIAGGRPADGLRLLAETLRHDPAFLLSLPWGRVVGDRLRRRTADRERGIVGRPFLPPPAALVRFVPPALAAFEGRRRCQAAGFVPRRIAEFP